MPIDANQALGSQALSPAACSRFANSAAVGLAGLHHCADTASPERRVCADPLPLCLMNFRHLRSFLAVCEQGSINRAANQTGRPKAAISRSVHELELALGVKLFDHDGDTLRCNAYAQALRHRVLRAISAFSSGLCSLEEKKRKGAKVDLHIPSDLFHEAHLDALVALTETGDITLAADRLGLAVPEITRALNKMGRNLGVRLFIRNQNGLAPTVPGKLFAFHASRALDELRCIKQDLYEQRNRQIPAQVA